MKKTSFAILALSILLLLAASAQAGVVITYTDTYKSGTAEAKSGTTILYLENDRFRTESKGAENDVIFIFRGDKKTAWIIEPAKKSYIQFTELDVKHAGAQMKAMRERYAQQMKNMPPEQAEAMKKMMEGSGMMGEPEMPKYKKVKSGVKVGKWNCTQYSLTGQQALKETMYTASLSALGLKSADFKAFKIYNEFIAPMGVGIMQPFPTGEADQEKKLGFSGVPVKSEETDLETGEITVNQFTKIQRQSVDSTLFDLPEGLTLQKQGPGQQ